MLVSHDRTTIETDSIDQETIAKIDEMLRHQSGGSASVLRVSHPRQTLEQKFLDIVEKAREERLETAGAMLGGKTASFLEVAAEGEELISKLVKDEEPVPHQIEPDAADKTPVVDDPSVGEVIEGLLAHNEPAEDSIRSDAQQETQTGKTSSPEQTKPDNAGSLSRSDSACDAHTKIVSDDVDSSVIDSLLDAHPEDEDGQQ